MRLRFHHTAFRIRKGSLDIVERLFRHLGFATFERLVTEHDAAIWMGVEGEGMVVQFNEVEGVAAPTGMAGIASSRIPRNDTSRTFSHIAFLDDDPRAATEALARWCGERGIVTRVGQWKDAECWLDCPDLFRDFVLEIMHPSVVRE